MVSNYKLIRIHTYTHTSVYVEIIIILIINLVCFIFIFFLQIYLGRDDQILFNGALFYLASKTLTRAENLPLWRTDGVIMTFLLHSGLVEFLYYWLHRALHHHYLYSCYHSHHHSSIATEPITCKFSMYKIRIWLGYTLIIYFRKYL